MLEDLIERMHEISDAIEIAQSTALIDHELWDGFNHQKLEAKGSQAAKSIYIPGRQEDTFTRYGFTLKMSH